VAASPPHALRGRLPNLSWRAASWEELRAHPRFTALPPVSELRLAGDEQQYALVRQDSALWWSLHAGRLTSSILLASVGAREPAAARRLGLPAAAAGRRHAVGAAIRLGQPLLVPGAGAEGAETAAAAASNAAAVAAFNAAAPPPPPPPPTSPPPPAAAAGRRRRRARHGPAIARSPEEAALRARCASASAGGDSGVRCAWGSAQEAGSLFSLLAAFPGARLLEAGLCVPSPAALQALALPAEALARLPPLGASPDGVLAWPAGSPYAPPGGEGLETQLEVVEVKNACPFRAHPAGGFALLDRGPPEALPPQHVPQLQLEMLCAGCGSGLLLCDSATRGAALFRMPRDDAYLALTLRLVASFAAAHVVPGGQGGGWPGGRAEVFGRGAEAAMLAEWISRTRALARAAALTDFLACPRRPDGADPRPWLE